MKIHLVFMNKDRLRYGWYFFLGGSPIVWGEAEQITRSLSYWIKCE